MDKREYNNINKISIKANVLLNSVMILYTVVCLFPIVLTIIISFTQELEILTHGYSLWPASFSLDAYTYLFSMGDVLWKSYGVSIFVTVIGTFFSLSIIALYAYPLSRSDFKQRNVMAFIVFFTMVFGGGLVPWIMVYLHLVPIKDSIWIMIVPYLINGWYVLIMRTFFKTTVPDSLLEAAKLDGAGEFRTFFSIVLPISKAGLATIGLFCTLGYWNDWYLPLVFVTKSELYNIQYLLFQTLNGIQFLSNSTTQISESASILANLPSEGARMAIAVLSIGPIIFAYPFFQRYFIQGLTIGALKG